MAAVGVNAAVDARALEIATAVLYVIGFIACVGRPRQTVCPWRSPGRRGAVRHHDVSGESEEPPPLFATPSDPHAAVIAGACPAVSSSIWSNAAGGMHAAVIATHKSKTPTVLRRWGLASINSLTMTYFHTGIRTIIGAESFHCPVRDGKEWDQVAMVVRLDGLVYWLGQ